MASKPTTRRESSTPEGAGSSTRTGRGGAIDELAGIPEAARFILSTAGFTKREQVATASDAELLQLDGIDAKLLEKVRASVSAEEAAKAAGALAAKAGSIAEGALGGKTPRPAANKKPETR